MSIGTASFDNNYRPAGAGANLAQILGSVEDKVFHEDADYTLFKQDQVKYTPHQSAVIVQGVANAGAGKTMVSVLTKTPDLLGNSYTMSSWLGIMGNCECGVTKTSYVNGRALYINKSSSIKIATQTLFTTDGHAQMIVMELMGVMDDYADMVGLCYTKEQLIENSKWDTILYAPWFALYPGQNREDLTFAIGTIAFHPVTYEQTNRGIHELVVNYDGISHRGRGLVALPIEINTGAVVSSSTVDFALANTYIWLSCEERLSLLNGYNETMFKEFIRVGEHSEGPSCNEKKVTFEVNIKGPTTYVWLTVQSRADIENGNWTKTFDDFGLDYITEFMLLTGNTPREDGLPASFYRTAKVMETFHVSIRRAVYVLSFEANDTAKQFTGHQTMTNFERINVQCLVKAHKCTLEFIAYAAVINGFVQEFEIASLL